MNRTKIEWCTHTWNPMTGCLHGCPYCYARKIAERFRGTKAWPVGFHPSFRRERLGEPCTMKKPAIIFAGSVTDIFGNWWLKGNIYDVLLTVVRTPHHRYVIPTKNPERAADVLLSYEPSELSHVYFATSVTGALPSSDEWVNEMKRLDDLAHIHAKGFKTAISFEPLLHNPADLIEISGGISWVDWIIIGGQTNPQKLPEGGWLNSIHYATEKPRFYKLNCFYEQHGVPAQFPADLLPIAQAWGKV